MGLFDEVFGARQQEDFLDFVNRYEQGPPWEGYSDQEVLARYGAVAHQVSPDEYERAAQDAFARLSPEERGEFGRFLERQAQQRHIDLPGFGRGQNVAFADPAQLARLVSELHGTPGLFRELLGFLTGMAEAPGGGGPGVMGTPQGFPAGSRGPGLEGVLSNPLAKAALAGIAAMLVKRMLAPQ
jgi:hypothetical protein